MYCDRESIKQFPPINSTNHTHLIGIHWEISSACQAACPCCIRKGNDNALAPFLQTYTTVETVEKMLEGIDELAHVSFCGNIGDPMTNPDITKICEFLKKKYKRISIKIHTNGGIGKSERFYELGKLGVRMIFGVDGTAGVNELHRAQVDFTRVDKNAREFMRGLKENRKEHPLNQDALFQVQFIVWDQNVFNIPDVIKWVQDIDGDEIFVRRTYGSYVTPVYGNEGEFLTALSYYDPDKYAPILEKVYHKTQFKRLLNDWSQIPNVNERVEPLPRSAITENSVVRNPEKIKFPQQGPYTSNQSTLLKLEKNKKTDVRCNAVYYDLGGELRTYIFITYQNIVMPCCFISSFYSSAVMGQISSFDKFPYTVDATEAETMNKLIEMGIDRFDGAKRGLKAILNDGTLDEFALLKVHTDDKLGLCAKYCAKRGGCHS